MFISVSLYSWSTDDPSSASVLRTLLRVLASRSKPDLECYYAPELQIRGELFRTTLVNKMASSIVCRGTRELSRRLHTNCVNTAGYQINYDQLREGQNKEVPPTTVQANVKNVVGWRGGAERGFLATYPNCIHVLTQEVTAEAPSMATWYRKVINFG